MNRSTATSPAPQEQKPLLPVQGFVSRLLPLKRLQELNQRVAADAEGTPFARVLRALQVSYSVPPAEFDRIPRTGAVVAVANHPFGMLDGVIAGDLMLRVRPDVKILTNRILAEISWLREYCIFVDPFGTRESLQQSQRGLREALRWLRGGGALIVFPAGEVSHWKLTRPIVTDPRWATTAARLARATGSDVLPVHFHGRNSVTFQALGVAHPRLRTLRLAHEFVNAVGKKVDVSVGHCISAEQFQTIPSDLEATAYLRWRTYLLRRAHKHGKVHGHKQAMHAYAPIAAAKDAARLVREIEALPRQALLCTNGDFDVYIATAEQVPNVLHEIGRLREVTFRGAGEGSGRELDLDEYDEYYKHVFVWDRTNQSLVGAYRLGEADHIRATRGLRGLYTSELFKYHSDFFDRLGPAVELGRSFVRQEYQRQYAPLLMLWKAIAAYICRHPETPILFGAVSISNEYSRTSRDLLVRFFEQEQRRHPLFSLVKPRAPFRASITNGWAMKSVLHLLADADALSAPISDLEQDGKDMPILLKQYVKLGGSVLAFNVDRSFASVLDALIAVDLRKIRREALNRYMGREQAAAFAEYHERLKSDS